MVICRAYNCFWMERLSESLDSLPITKKWFYLLFLCPKVYLSYSILAHVNRYCLLEVRCVIQKWFSPINDSLFQENFQKLGILFGADNPAESHPFENLKNQDCYAPQLFLYSKHDKLVPHTDVENFANYRQRNRGVHVQMQCFENDDAEHVKLYASQPQRYVQSVCEFINDCFACNYEISQFASKKD